MSGTLLDLTMGLKEEVHCRYKFRPVLKEFLSKTHFSKEEFEALLIIHYKLTKKRQMDRKYFRSVMYRMLNFQNDIFIDHIFSALDRNNKLVLTMDSWILGLSVLLRGTLKERVQFCFKVYDWMGDGFLRRDLMFQALKNTYRGFASEEDPEETVRDVIDIIMKKMDHDRDGVLSFDDYSTSVYQNPDLLEFLGYCMPERPAVYAFMTTFTSQVTTMHALTKTRRNTSNLRPIEMFVRTLTQK